MERGPSLPADPAELLAADAFVRRLARELVADADSAQDVAQQAWLAAVEDPPRDAMRRRGWLATVVRRSAARLRRTVARRREREQAAARSEALPSLEEYREREGLRRAVVDAIFALDEPYRTTLLLRFLDDLPPRRVAGQMNVPVETVRTRVRRGLELVRARLDALQHNDRGAWVALLLPLARRPEGAAAAAGGSLVLGGLLVSLQSKLVASAAVLVAAATCVWWTLAHGPRSTVVGPEGPHPGAAATATDEGVDAPEPAAVAAAREAESEPEPPEPAPLSPLLDATGALDVRIVDERGLPLEGVAVSVDDARSRAAAGEELLAWSGPDGSCSFERVAVGAVLVVTDVAHGARARVKPGERTDVTIRLDADSLQWCSEVTGIVLDGDGQPVEDAEIDVVMRPRSGMGPPSELHEVARSGEDGRFTLARAAPGTLVGARAPGFTPSRWIEARRMGDSRRMDVRLVVSEPAGEVLGRVVDEHGAPVPDALVLLGDELRWLINQQTDERSGRTVHPRIPRVVRTDADGRFEVGEVAPGREPVVARARGFAPWFGSVEIHVDRQAVLEIVLERGARIEGFVRDAEGAPVGGAEIRCGPRYKFTSTAARSLEDGSFRLDGLPPGPASVEVVVRERGRSTAALELRAGETLRWDATLDPGATIRGLLRSESGEPLERWRIEARGPLPGASPPEHLATTWTDAEDRFVLEHLSAARYELSIRDQEFHAVAAAARRGVTPSERELEIVVRASALPSAEIVGSIRTPDGAIPAGVEILIGGKDVGGGSRMHEIDPSTGRFRIGPLPAGDYWFQAQAPGFPELVLRSVKVEPNGRTDLGELRLAPPASLLLSLRGDGVELTGASVRLNAANGFERTAPVLEGVARLEGLPAGESRVVLAGPRIAAQEFLVPLRAGETTERTIDVTSGVPVKLRIASPATPPGPDAIPSVGIEHAGTKVLLLHTICSQLPHAPFEWEVRLAPGRYTVSISLGLNRRHEVALEIGPDDALDRVVEIEPP